MNDDQERLKRLRDRQLAERDPKVKQKQIQKTITQKERKLRKERYSLSEAWRTIPHVYRNPLFGLLIGICITIFLPSVWDSIWALGVGVIATIFLIIMGVIIGQAMDFRDDLKDF